MKRILKATGCAACAVALCTAFAACSNSGAQRDAATTQTTPQPTTQSHVGKQTTSEQPLPAESNPPGDIPDTQRFVTYTSARFYSIAAPEGWAQTMKGGDVVFSDKFDGEQLSSTAVAAITENMKLASASVDGCAGSAVRNCNTQPITLPGGSATKVTYTSNSQPDDVTGKRVRLQNEAYEFHKSGHIVTIRLWAPLGTDNVDQWRHIAQSFKWL